MFETINGFTKARIVDMIINGNKGYPSNAGRTDPNCNYRGVGDNKCAVGCFIPDNLYNANMEGYGIGNLLIKFPDLNRVMPLPFRALEQLQATHDKYSGTELDPRPDLINWIDKNILDACDSTKP